MASHLTKAHKVYKQRCLRERLWQLCFGTGRGFCWWIICRKEKQSTPKDTVRLTKLRRAIQNKRRGRLTKGVVLLHDNARVHVSRQTTAKLEEFGWDIFGHPPYSPDLAPSDYHMFPALKKHLGRQKFASDEEVVEAVDKWLKEVAGEWYNTGITKLVDRMKKVTERQGDYVEK